MREFPQDRGAVRLMAAVDAALEEGSFALGDELDARLEQRLDGLDLVAGPRRHRQLRAARTRRQSCSPPLQRSFQRVYDGARTHPSHRFDDCRRLCPKRDQRG